MDKKELVCIVCPRGCRLTIENIDNKLKVCGNSCNRGEVYGVKEITNPVRVLTTTVKINGCKINRLPVKTEEGIPKDMLFKCMNFIDSIEVNAPVKVGDIIVKNILDTGVNLVSSKTINN